MKDIEGGRKVNILPFSNRLFSDVNSFKQYIMETLPNILLVEHTQVRTPDVIVFAYQGTKSLWGYVEVEGWRKPTEMEVKAFLEWAGKKPRRTYLLKACTIRLFEKHVAYFIIKTLNPKTIVYAPNITHEEFVRISERGKPVNVC